MMTHFTELTLINKLGTIWFLSIPVTTLVGFCYGIYKPIPFFNKQYHIEKHSDGIIMDTFQGLMIGIFLPVSIPFSFFTMISIVKFKLFYKKV